MNKKIPKRRFKGFTENWEQRELKEIGKDYSGLSGKTKKDFGHGESLYVPYKNIFNNHIVDVNNLEKVNVESKQNKVSYGDIFFTISSEIPEEVGMSSVMGEDIENLYLNSFSFGLRPHKETHLDVIFSSYLFRTPTFRKKMYILAQGISRYNISKTNVMRLVVELPSFNEQKKIGEILYKLESMITLHKRKFEKLKQLQKSYLNESIFSEPKCVPKRRFKGFTDDWEQEKLKNISTVSSCKRIYKNETHELGEIPFYKIGTIGKKPDSYITREIFENYKQNYDYPDYGDTIITASGSIGRLFQYQGEEAYFQDSNLVWLNFKLEMNKDYTYYYLNRIRWAVEGTTITRLYNKNILSSIFKYPNLEEQKKIAKLLNTIDKTISLHKRKHNAIKKSQKIYLQNNLKDETYA